MSNCISPKPECYTKDKACRDLLEVFGNLKTKTINKYITNIVNAEWGNIEGDISNQTDLWNLLQSLSSPSFTITAGEDLLVNDLIYIASDGLAYKASAVDSTSEAAAVVIDEINQEQEGLAYPSPKVLEGFTGLTIGSTYYLSITPGEISDTIPSDPSQIVQQVAKALSATTIYFEPKISILIV